MQTRRFTVAFAVLGLVLFTACAGPEDSAATSGAGEGGADGETTSLSYGVSTTNINTALSTYSSLPLALSYWEEEGLSVEVLGFAGGGATIQAMEAGQIDVAVIGSSTVMSAVAAGAEVDTFFTQTTKNFYLPTVPEDSEITEISQLEGASIGVPSLEASSIPAIEAMVEAEGISKDSLEFIAIGTGAEAYAFVESGRIEVLGLFDAAAAEIEALGQPLRTVSNEFFDNLGYQQVVVAPDSQVEENPEAMLGFARGIAKAMVFAEASPEAAVRLHWEVYPESKPTGVDEATALEQGVRALDARIENSQPVNGVYGLATDQQIQDYMQVLIDSGQLETELDVEELWTDEFLDDINDFDADGIRREAESRA